MPDKCNREGIIIIRRVSHGDDKGRATKVEELVQTKDIIEEEMPPLLTQLACSAESRLLCFCRPGVTLHPAQSQHK